MAIITKISAQKRAGRYNIFLDGEYAFAASERTVAEYVLLKGKELTDAQIGEIKQFETNSKASELIANYLSYQPRTVYEVLQYLKTHEVDETAAQDVVARFTELGYLNDRQYTVSFIKNDLAIGQDGPRIINQKLLKKGVASTIIEDELDKIADEDWFEVAQRAVKSMGKQLRRFSAREFRQKLTNKLLAHGFNGNLADDLIDRMDLPDQEEAQQEALRIQGIKAYKRFKRLDAQERNFKIKRYLYSHGFSSSEISAFLSGEIVDLDELEEY